MRSARYLFWLTPPALALALYGPTLSLPFFWDDVANFQFMFGRPLAQMWVDSSGFPYYRPLTFTLWRAMQIVFGATNPAPYHALNILTLIADAWLVGMLAKRIQDPSDLRDPKGLTNLIALFAAALMTVFPFAALVVPLVASLFHLFVTLVTVGACLCLLEYEKTKRVGWGIAAVALAALAPFAHESGLAVSALMGICFSTRITHEFHEFHEKNSSVRVIRAIRGQRWAAIFVAISLLLNLAFIPLWSRIPKARPEGEFAWVGWESLGQSIVFFLEGLTFPFQFLARPLMSIGWADLWAVLALAIIAIAAALIALRGRRWLIFGVAYCFTAALPAMAALPFSYIIVSPRLMVFTAPASAILWGAVVVEATRRIAKTNLRAAIAATLVTLIGIAPAHHIIREVRLHHIALDHLWTFVNDVQSRPNDDLLVVNAVNWVAPVSADYALGHEGVEVMPAYLNLQLIAWVHTQTLYPVDAVTFPLVFPELKGIYFSTWGDALDWDAMAERVRKADRVAIVRYSDDRVEYMDAGRVTKAQSNNNPIVSFENRIWLTKIEAAPTGNAINLRLNWQVNAASGEDIFAHAFDCAGNVLGLADGAGIGGVYPIWLWQAGELIEEVRHIALTAPSPEGCYVIELGLFNPQTGARAEARDAKGERLENDVVIVNSEIVK